MSAALTALAISGPHITRLLSRGGRDDPSSPAAGGVWPARRRTIHAWATAKEGGYLMVM